MDWIRLFQDHNIPYVTSGKNVSKNNLGIKCPYCGENDPSFHLGVNPFTGQWNCWRDADHKGSSPYRLISTLLGVSGAQAKLVIQGYAKAGPDEFDALTSPTGAPEAIRAPVELPLDFKPIEANTLTHKFWLYLQKRGFDNPDKVINSFDLKCCLTGKWKGRLIIPVYGPIAQRLVRPTFNRDIWVQFPVGSPYSLVGWQGRAIRAVDPRYLTSSSAVKKTLFNLQNISDGGVTLYICEGPFDAMKIDYYGRPDIRATCTFGVNVTPEQIEMLYKLSSKFLNLLIIFDTDHSGISGAFSLSDWLPQAKFGRFPEGHKDTDLMSPQQIKEWLATEV